MALGFKENYSVETYKKELYFIVHCEENGLTKEWVDDNVHSIKSAYVSTGRLIRATWHSLTLHKIDLYEMIGLQMIRQGLVDWNKKKFQWEMEYARQEYWDKEYDGRWARDSDFSYELEELKEDK